MPNPSRPSADSTRVSSTASMRARNVSRDAVGEAAGLKTDVEAEQEPPPRRGETDQPVDRPDS
jgi:hypothetical protein